MERKYHSLSFFFPKSDTNMHIDKPLCGLKNCISSLCCLSKSTDYIIFFVYIIKNNYTFAWFLIANYWFMIICHQLIKKNGIDGGINPGPLTGLTRMKESPTSSLGQARCGLPACLGGCLRS